MLNCTDQAFVSPFLGNDVEVIGIIYFGKAILDTGFSLNWCIRHPVRGGGAPSVSMKGETQEQAN